jgi:hypothetical protein
MCFCSRQAMLRHQIPHPPSHKSIPSAAWHLRHLITPPAPPPPPLHKTAQYEVTAPSNHTHAPPPVAVAVAGYAVLRHQIPQTTLQSICKSEPFLLSHDPEGAQHMRAMNHFFASWVGCAGGESSWDDAGEVQWHGGFVSWF